MSISILMLAARIALAVCLYAFLTVILIVLWRDLRAAQSSGSTRLPILRRLLADGTSERSYSLPKDSCLIGRSPSVEVSLSDETVSAVHARLWKDGNRWWLEDLESRNGTFLNEIPVAKSAVLCTGDRIRIGRIQLEFRAHESGASAPAQNASPPPEEAE
jgi:pSer/pThr/pTyr-binding forkhead associated (FHA) protein